MTSEEEARKNACSSVLKGFCPSIDNNEGPIDDHDFSKQFEVLSDSFRKTEEFIENLIHNESNLENVLIDQTFAKSFFVRLIILCYENMEPMPWNLKPHLNASKRILNKLLLLYKSESVHILLIENKIWKSDMMSWCLEEIRPKLLINTWKDEPASQEVYKHLLRMIKYPQLSQFLAQVLPTTIIILEDFEVKNKLFSIKCVDYILDNVTSTEMKWYGRAEMILFHLKKLLYMSDVTILENLIPCILKCIKICESMESENGCMQINEYDKFMSLYLNKMEMEDKLVLRRVYSSNLQLAVVALQVRNVRWFSALIRIFKNYLEVEDFEEEKWRIDIISVIEYLLKEIKHFSELYCKEILEILIKLLYNITKSDKISQSGETLVENVKSCLVLISKNQPDKVKIYCKGIKKVNVNSKLFSYGLDCLVVD